MKVFDLIGNVPNMGRVLTVSEFEKATTKKKPYFQEKEGNMKHYAICPECRNPIVIVNLYTDTSSIEGSSAPLHARHVRGGVAGLANYNEGKYKSCVLANPKAFTCKDTRTEGDISNELLSILISNAKIIRTVMSQSIGLNINDWLFEKVLQTFKSERGHLYRFVNRYNLPYAIMYLMGNQPIKFQYVMKNEAGNNLKKAIIEKCEYSTITKDGQVKLNDSSVNIRIYLTNHIRNQETGDESLLMNVEEVKGNSSTTILKHKIKFDDSLFVNWVNKDKRSSDIAREVFRYRSSATKG